MGMGRPKKTDYPPYMLRDKRRGGFIVRNPITGKQKSFADEDTAREAALALAKWVENERRLDAYDKGLPTVGWLVELWKAEQLKFMPWDTGTRENMLAKMHRIQRELGERPIKRVDRLALLEWLSFCRTADQFNDWRYAFALLWDLAVLNKLANQNEARLIPPRSTSKKLEMNRKRRQRLDAEGFKIIHNAAPAWLQIAMELSFITLQARAEVCNMRHADFRDGYLFVIRDKVSADSDMAFIKIAVTPAIEELRKRSLRSSRIASPFLVHRAPARKRREWLDGKPHWTYVEPAYLTRAFARVRNALEPFRSMPPEARPGFHEIRSLGARTYRRLGVPETAIQALMTHAHKRTTQIYLDRGAEALTADDFVPVTATLTMGDL